LLLAVLNNACKKVSSADMGNLPIYTLNTELIGFLSTSAVRLRRELALVRGGDEEADGAAVDVDADVNVVDVSEVVALVDADADTEAVEDVNDCRNDSAALLLLLLILLAGCVEDGGSASTLEVSDVDVGWVVGAAEVYVEGVDAATNIIGFLERSLYIC
jgi:hypothetical protein